MPSKKTASIRPSSFAADESRNLNLGNRKEVLAIRDIPLDDFLIVYDCPHQEPEEYLDMRGVPSIWSRMVDRFSVGHLFLYSFCLFSGDDKVKKLSEVRLLAEEKCDSSGNEAGALWLDMRPRYVSTLSSPGKNRRSLPTWDKRVKGWMVSGARKQGLTARHVFIEYSIIAMLKSEKVSSSGYVRSLSLEAENWSNWLVSETDQISKFFVLK